MNCHRCGQPASEDELILFEERWICAACKPVVVQELKEGCSVAVADPLPEGFEERMLSFWTLVSLSWRVVCRDALAIGGLMVLAGVPVNLVFLTVVPGEGSIWVEFARHLSISQFFEIMVSVLTSLGIAKIVEQRLLGREVSFGGGLSHAVRYWIPAIVTGSLEILIIGLLSLALLVPGIIWTFYYTFSRIVVSLREVSGKAALDYSKSLVKGRWWGVVGRSFGLTILSLLPYAALKVAISFVPEHPAVTFATGLFCYICFGYAIVGTTVLFLNLDAIRRGGLVSDVPPPPL
jgi:hypothetical protein